MFQFWILPILKILWIAILLYILACLYLYFNQDSLLFIPRKVSDTTRNTLENYKENIENISITTGDGIILKGWMVNKNPERKNIVIFFGWNNQEVSSMITESSTWKDWMTILMNYRWYWESEWIPSENNFYADAEKVYDTISPTGKVVVMGRSIGTGVATYLATKRKVDGVILVTPYDSITSVAQENYPLLPIKLIAKYSFDSLSRAPIIKVPMMSIVASEDTIVPSWHAKALFEKWWGPKKEIIITWANHNSITKYDGYKNAVIEFLDSVK